MNHIFCPAIILELLLIFVLKPFAVFAPLLLMLMVAGAYWFCMPML
ncbi:MAG: hypothetical protein AAFQ23_03840 [Cyanobacteria bacterium J06623_1]